MIVLMYKGDPSICHRHRIMKPPNQLVVIYCRKFVFERGLKLSNLQFLSVGSTWIGDTQSYDKAVPIRNAFMQC